MEIKKKIKNCVGGTDDPSDYKTSTEQKNCRKICFVNYNPGNKKINKNQGCHLVL